MTSDLPKDSPSLCQCGDPHCFCGGCCVRLASILHGVEKLCFGCYLEAVVPLEEGVEL